MHAGAIATDVHPNLQDSHLRLHQDETTLGADCSLHPWRSRCYGEGGDHSVLHWWHPQRPVEVEKQSYGKQKGVFNQ